MLVKAKVMALEKIGPYKFQGVLGRGGMGTVYRGVHEDTGEIVAIKVLAPTYAHDEHFRGRFESEIKALIKLDHKNIVRLISYGQEDAMLFFSMELVEGNSLFQMQRKGHRFDWREILDIAKDVSQGLRHAHDRGIIHRDLKPGNLLMTMDEDGKPDYVKITDFGIAKRFGSSQNTGENVLGTMDFMSPEQAKGEPVTIRSDLYSLGTVMFTLLSGRPPFTSNSVEESLRNLTRVPAPRVSSMVPEVPDEIDDLIKRLMAKRPENRIQTAQALFHQIEEVEHDLRTHSEARTAHRTPPSQTHDTFDVGVPQTKANTHVSKDNAEPLATSIHSQTIEFTDHTQNEPSLSQTQKDYFNTVTEKHRKEIDAIAEESKSSKGVLPLVFALVAVLALAAYGVYRVSLPPSAEELFTRIELSADQPHRVLEEIDTFLGAYPNEERAPIVANMKKVGESINLYNSLCNTLSVRRNLPGDTRLTEIEKQFLGIVDVAETNPDAAMKKMAAFVNVHQGTNLSPRDQKCVDAAQGYAIKIRNDARAKILLNLKQIRLAMKRASQMTDTDDGIELYQSILKLYGGIQWGNSPEGMEGQDLVRKAKGMLETFKAAKLKADEEEARQKAIDEKAESEEESTE